jgi:two-component system, sensor histidine kinase and response regulator
MPRVMIINVEEISWVALALTLQPQGWKVQGVCSGREATEMLRLNPPDAILCDLDTPAQDDMEGLLQARRESALLQVPFVVCTTPNVETTPQFSALEADAVLYKPFGRNQLIDALEKPANLVLPYR